MIVNNNRGVINVVNYNNMIGDVIKSNNNNNNFVTKSNSINYSNNYSNNNKNNNTNNKPNNDPTKSVPTHNK